MNSDFFVRLTMATHKVADILPRQDPLRLQIEDSANKLLVSLILLAEDVPGAIFNGSAGASPKSPAGVKQLTPAPVTKEQKRSVTPRAIRELGVLIAYLNYVKRTVRINPGNFLVLEREYNRVGEFLRQLHQDTAKQVSEHVRPPGSNMSTESVAPKRDLGAPKSRLGSRQDSNDLSGRQTRILAIIRNKPKTQVWELQKVLPEVTKRTLRRDLDDLLHRHLVIRQGEWNEVFYQIR